MAFEVTFRGVKRNLTQEFSDVQIKTKKTSIDDDKVGDRAHNHIPLIPSTIGYDIVSQTLSNLQTSSSSSKKKPMRTVNLSDELSVSRLVRPCSVDATHTDQVAALLKSMGRVETEMTDSEISDVSSELSTPSSTYSGRPRRVLKPVYKEDNFVLASPRKRKQQVTVPSKPETETLNIVPEVLIEDVITDKVVIDEAEAVPSTSGRPRRAAATRPAYKEESTFFREPTITRRKRKQEKTPIPQFKESVVEKMNKTDEEKYTLKLEEKKTLMEELIQPFEVPLENIIGYRTIDIPTTKEGINELRQLAHKVFMEEEELYGNPNQPRCKCRKSKRDFTDLDSYEITGRMVRANGDVLYYCDWKDGYFEDCYCHRGSEYNMDDPDLDEPATSSYGIHERDIGNASAILEALDNMEAADAVNISTDATGLDDLDANPIPIVQAGNTTPRAVEVTLQEVIKNTNDMDEDK